MPDAAIEATLADDAVDRIVAEYGSAAIDYMLALIWAAVRAGDDAGVEHLDRIMRLIEQRRNGFGSRRKE